ncbi:pseudouridine synthase [Candidatus Mycoplasma pogonae]
MSKNKNKKQELIYLAFHKPSGCVSALKDNLHPTIMEFIPTQYQNLHIVGRLDKDTTGLIFLTNDGQFTHFATHNKKQLGKTYRITLLKPFQLANKAFLENAFYIDYGKTLITGGKVEMINEYEILLTITEGKYHQVKKMIFNIDNEVVKLHRIAIGELSLNSMNLKLGEVKEFNPKILNYKKLK